MKHRLAQYAQAYNQRLLRYLPGVLPADLQRVATEALLALPSRPQDAADAPTDLQLVFRHDCM